MKYPLFLMLATVCFLCGCETEHYVSDSKHPDVAITAAGGVTFRGEFVDPEDLPGLLRRSAYQRTDTIYIGAPDDMADWRLKRKVMAILSRNGFTRPVLVGTERSYSEAGRTADQRRADERTARQQKLEERQRTQSRRREIRYK